MRPTIARDFGAPAELSTVVVAFGSVRPATQFAALLSEVHRRGCQIARTANGEGPSVTTQQYDVAVIGGGSGGLSAALQLKDLRPQTRIAVFEKTSYPAPPTAYKVGESLADVAAYYFNDVIGIGDHLESEHLRKMGLRWWCPGEDGNKDIARRHEIGLARFSPLANFHIDRGVLENHMMSLASDRGIVIQDNTGVSHVDLKPDRHTLTIEHAGGSSEVDARWVVDASGPRRLLRQQLDLGSELPIPNNENCSFFRVPYQLKVDEWSDDPAWQARVPSGTRYRSTNLFVGRGFWMWVINLGSGSCSVGVVTDPAHVPYERIRRYDALLDFLREVEPQIAAHLPPTADGVLDFLRRRRYTHTVRRTFSRQRWALSGEAGVFINPMYSTGHDTGAISNTLLTDLIRRNLDGDDGADFTQRVRQHNRSMLGIVTILRDVFPGALAVYGQPEATGCKLAWDNSNYFALLMTLFRSGGLLDVELMRSLQPLLLHATELNVFMQSRFMEWGATDKDLTDVGVPQMTDAHMEDLFTTPLRALGTQELREHMAKSVSRMEAMATEMCSRMSGATGQPLPPLPYEPSPVRNGNGEFLLWSDRALRLSGDGPQTSDNWLVA
jgi:flavin-dependent dehydrogenase